MKHHPDCDGYRHHVVTGERTEHGTYKPVCNLCGPLPLVGSTGTPQLAVHLVRDHVKFEDCAGQCGAWT